MSSLQFIVGVICVVGSLALAAYWAQPTKNFHQPTEETTQKL